MTAREAREAVVLAGRMLVESGLVARTWGNVSCRISSSHFVITPSGRDYMSLTPEEIVEVAVLDCSYSGDIKPSSEKRIHAEVYKRHPEANFVIHTHQSHTSEVSVLMLDFISVPEEFTSLKGEVVCAAYGLPGTKKLLRGVAEALAHSKGNAVIMKNHGTLCFGRDYEEAFKVAHELESACEQFIQKQYVKLGNTSDDPLQRGLFALSRLAGIQFTENFIKNVTEKNTGNLSLCESERTGKGFKLNIGDRIYDVVQDQLEGRLIDASILKEIKIHGDIYKKHPEINNILHAGTPGMMAVSYAGLTVLPLLDDFAQIAGTSVKTFKEDEGEFLRALKKASAVFVQGKGALCCGASKGDAQSVGMVVEKNCNALISSALFGKEKYINRIECLLMRFVYLRKYSKQVNIK